MGTNANNTEEKDLGDKKWNNLQDKTHLNEELNEGFSSDNIPDNYNPADENIEDRLKDERETDEHGNKIDLSRSRYPDNVAENKEVDSHKADNRIIENKESLQNRDRNYDLDPNRYPSSHPENQENRGNIQLDDK